MSNLLAGQDADGRPLGGQGYDPTTNQFSQPQTGPAVTDPDNLTAYAPLYVAPVDGQKPTYSFARSTFAIAATPTDVAIVNGSATKTVRVTHIEIDALCTAATAVALEVQLIKRSTANTGGTSTGSPTPVPHDSNSAAGTSTVLCYTANPTTGTAVGIVRDGKLVPVLSPYTATDFPQHDKLIWDFGNRPGQGIVLHGVAEGLAINLVGATIPAGLSMGISIEVTEES